MASPNAPQPALAEKESSHFGAYMALTAALLGWMFDGAEMGVFSLVGRQAIKDLLSKYLADLPPVEQEGAVGLWFGIIMAAFLIGAATGGVVFGWLGDRIGRVRAMSLSILTYALFTGLCGFTTSAWQVGVLRFIAALGMGGEWSLGVALVMEIWPNKSRTFMAGLIGAAANVGYLLVGFIGLGLLQILDGLHTLLVDIGLPQATADLLVANRGWRIMMILGTVPALLTFLIRIFVPESEKWEAEQKKGTTSNWASQDLLGVLLGLIGPALIVYLWAAPSTGAIPHTVYLRLLGTFIGLAIVTWGYTFPVIRYYQRQAQATGNPAAGNWLPTLRRMLLAAALSSVPLVGTWGSTQWAPTWADKMVESSVEKEAAKLESAGDADGAKALRTNRPKAKEHTLIWLSVGAVVGTILAALSGDALGRRSTYCLLCVCSFASIFALYVTNTEYGPRLLFFAFLAGACTASFYGWLPLYLPELFRTSVRATGQGFGFNFGRIIAAVGALIGGQLTSMFPKDYVLGPVVIPHGYPLACTCISMVYAIGLAVIWLAPETKGQPLPD